MWKLLSGIVLIVLLDVAFIWMMAAEPDAPEIARAIGPAAAPVIYEQPSTEPEAIDDSKEPVDDSYEVRDVRRSRQNYRGMEEAARVAQPEAATVTAKAPAKLFQDTIIWIGRTEVPVKIDNREEVPVIAEPKQEDTIQASIAEPKASEKKKRSFESKAFGVIKKPYEWMKAFADKLH